MSTRRFRTDDRALDGLYDRLSVTDLQPLWELTGLLTPEPVVGAVPYRWSGEELRALGEASGELVPVERGGDRRVLACCNPGLDGAPYAVPTLWAAVQYLRAGEVAPAHRHTPAALRFITQGQGVWTLVDGDPIHMSEGDLVLTPSWTFHEHHNPSPEAMTWMDVLDLPIVAALGAVFFEDGPTDEASTATAPQSTSESWYGGGPGLVPVAGPSTPETRSPLLAYRWADTDRALAAQLQASGRGVAAIRFADPVRGGDVMPTLRCEMHRVESGRRTDRTRQTGGRVACILHGTGSIAIGGETFDVGPGDILAIPSWSAWDIQAETELDLFSTSDAPVLEALGLMRHDTVAAADLVALP